MLTALYKRELGSFFFNYSAYFIFAVYMVFSLVFAVFVGMYFVVDNPAMRSYFAFQPLVLSQVRLRTTVRSPAARSVPMYVSYLGLMLEVLLVLQSVRE